MPIFSRGLKSSINLVAGKLIHTYIAAEEMVKVHRLGFWAFNTDEGGVPIYY